MYDLLFICMIGVYIRQALIEKLLHTENVREQRSDFHQEDKATRK